MATYFEILKKYYEEWQEEIDEEELDELVKNEFPLEDGIEEAHWNNIQYKLREAYKAGYHKALMK